MSERGAIECIAATELMEALLADGSKKAVIGKHTSKKVREFLDYNPDQATIQSLEEERDELVGILKIAKCPNPGCDNKGSIAHGSGTNWEQEQCQWCYEKDAAIAKHRSKS